MKLEYLALLGTLPSSFLFDKEQLGNPSGTPFSPDRQGSQSLASFLDSNTVGYSGQDADFGQGDAETLDGDYLALARDALTLIERMAPQGPSDVTSNNPMDMLSSMEDAASVSGIASAAPDEDPAPPTSLEEVAGAASLPAAFGNTDTPPADTSGAPASASGNAGGAGLSTSVDTGTGTGQLYNVHNGTDRDQYFLYSDSSGHKAVMEVKPGQVGTFTGGNNQPGIRIQTCGPDGETRSPANEALFEAGTQTTSAGVVNNPDVSDVDGNLSYDGYGTDIEIDDNIGQKVGNLTGDAYRNWNDDIKTDASNPMTMAQTRATSFDIYFSDSSQTLATPGNR